MASIFLSYARDDAARAKTLANALERAGHAVWWDRHIDGGAEFSGEIEAALNGSDIVLVLWSEAAVRSAWVRDEAAEGRDSGRLVPVLLDGCAPPLGFRQLQSISLAGWSGRGNPPRLSEILKAIAARSGKEQPITAPTANASITRQRPAFLLGLGLFGALLVAVGAWWFLEGRGRASETPVLAVLPFSDLSPERDKAYFAEGVAEAILTVLAKEPGIRVVGRSTAHQLHNAGDRAEKMRRAIGVTHVLEGSARSVGNQLRMSVRLIDASDGQQLWAEEYRRRLDNIFAVQDEIGRAVAQRLKGSFTSNASASRQLTSVDAYTLYLAARAKIRDRRLPSLQDGLKMARQVIAADPNYAPGHALYAELIWQMSYENYGNIPIERVREIARPHALRAIQLAPESADGHAALGVISRGDPAIQSLTRAIRLDPARAELRLWLARELERLGRNDEGLEHLKAAHEMDPLFAPAMWNVAWWLASSLRFEEARAIVAGYERRGGSRAIAASVRAQLSGFYQGDFSEGIRFGEMAVAADPDTPTGRPSLSSFYEKVGLYEDAARNARSLPVYSRIWATGDYRRLAARVLADGSKTWEQPDFDLGIAALALDRNWVAITRLYDSMPNRERLCRGSGVFHMGLLVDLAKALSEQRRRESEVLRTCLKRVYVMHSQGSVRSATAPAPFLNIRGAEIHAIEGRASEAFRLLERAINGGVRTGYGRGLFEVPAFDAYRSSPEYARADARLKQLVARERAEVLRMRRSQRRAA